MTDVQVGRIVIDDLHLLHLLQHFYCVLAGVRVIDCQVRQVSNTYIESKKVKNGRYLRVLHLVVVQQLLVDVEVLEDEREQMSKVLRLL